jgi:peptide/nickel transport system substrate-binding protein
MMNISRHARDRKRGATTCVLLTLAAGLLIAELPAMDCLAQNQIEIFETRAVTGYDPFTFRGLESYRLLSLYSAPLIELDASGEPENRLAASIDQGDRVWTIHLRPNLYFADGHLFPQADVSYEPLTARDVEATYRAFIDSRNEVGDPAFRENLKYGIEDLKAVDDRTVAVQFKREYKTGFRNRVLEFPIMPAKLLTAGFATRGQESAIIRRPYGTGYYFIQSRRPQAQVWELSRNEKLPESTKAIIEKISFDYNTNYDSKLNDIAAGNYIVPICIPDVPVEKIGLLSTGGYHRLYPLTKNRYNYIAFNCDRPVLKDRRVRQALSCAINRNHLLGTYQNEGDPVTGPFPSDSPNRCDTCDTPFQIYNPDLAKKLLEEAGWQWQASGRRVNGQGQTLTIELVTYGGESGSVPALVANRIRGFWEEIGVTTNVSNPLVQEYNQRVFGDRDFDASFGIWSYFLAPNPSPTFRTKGTQNFISYSNPEVDLLLDSIPRLGTDEKTLLYHRIHKKIADDAPYAFLYTINRYALLSTNINVGPNIEPFNFLRRINKWYIQ